MASHERVSESGERFVAEYRKNAETLARDGLYDPSQEHDSCGVGLVAAIDGKPRREVVTAGIAALKVLWHRGAVDADGKTGDGAGIHVQIPQSFLKEHIRDQGHEPGEGRLAVGMIFLPRTDFAAQERCRCIVEAEILAMGYGIYGWRQVPIDISVIGEKANATRPEIEQILINNTKGTSARQFEIDLFIIRRRIEKQVLAESIRDFYICSLSCRSVIYKGMFLAEQLTAFYPDLLDERFVSNFAIYHQRYSTNTFPTWWLAQPFRMLAHNGEINTLLGNVNWMKAHEPRMAHEWFGRHMADLLPVVQPGSSDSMALDAVFEIMVRANRSVPMVKTILVPEAWADHSGLPQEIKELYSYCNAIMEPWDGPAAICAYGGQWAVAFMDRNGLRPMRYTLTGDGLLIVGSETGMVRLDETAVIEKGRIGPGQMIAVDLRAGKLYHDREAKKMLAEGRPYGQWVKQIEKLDSLIKKGTGERVEFEREELRRRQVAVGWTLEDLEIVLHPMAEDAKEPVGSMGDDTPLAVLSEQHRGLHHYFRQNFSQVTNPPIDSLRETRVMSLVTRLGNLGNILDEDESQCRLLQLELARSLERRVRGDARPHGLDGSRRRLHLRCQEGRRRLARGDRPYPAGSRGRGARRRPASRALRQGLRRRARAHSHDSRGGSRALPSRAQEAAHLLLAQRAQRRVPGRALFRRPHRRGCHHGQCLLGTGDACRPPPARSLRDAFLRGGAAPLQGRGRPGAAQDHVQDGHRGDQLLPRGL